MIGIAQEWLLTLGLRDRQAGIVAAALGLVICAALGVVAYFLAKRIVVLGLTRWARRSSTAWDDLLIEHHVARRAAYLVPVLGIYAAMPTVLAGYEGVVQALGKILLLAMVLLGVWLFHAVLDAIWDAYRRKEPTPDYAIEGPVQAAKLGTFLVGMVLAISILLGRSPVYLFTGLGALSAVLMLVFKDPITGLAAGIQLSTNRMVAPGDWIEMPRYDANGDVLEVGLTTVKVQNWDKTVTTIPTQALVNESFKNWRGMQEAGGRRIKRSIALDMRSIRRCTLEMLERLQELGLGDEDLAARCRAPAGNGDASAVLSPGGGRRLTNLGAFRAYTERYLRAHPMIHQNMTLLVRQLQPTEHGLPIELYTFCKTTDWGRYESVQAEIFEHLLAVLPDFELRVFQHWTTLEEAGAPTDS